MTCNGIAMWRVTWCSTSWLKPLLPNVSHLISISIHFRNRKWRSKRKQKFISFIRSLQNEEVNKTNSISMQWKNLHPLLHYVPPPLHFYHSSVSSIIVFLNRFCWLVCYYCKLLKQNWVNVCLQSNYAHNFAAIFVCLNHPTAELNWYR